MPYGLVASTCAAASAALLAIKFVLAGRININWDEFFFLSNVYALARDELGVFMQGAYTHAFLWITATAGDEVTQIVRLRFVMCALLVCAAFVIYALSRLWASRAAACFAVLAFLATWPVLKHGASFRADSILLPLTLAAFWLALRRSPAPDRDAILAGGCLGVGFVVTVKVVLLSPALVLAVLLRDDGRNHDARASLRAAMRHLLLAFVAAAVLATLLLIAHVTQLTVTTEPAQAFAPRAFKAMLLDVPFIPRREYIWRLVTRDPIFWITAAGGFLVAVRRRNHAAAALALCFLPLLFYRNAFPYYYPVMMGPAAALVAIAADALREISWRGRRWPAAAAAAIVCVALVRNAWDNAMTLRFDDQSAQRAVVSAVHQLFPRPVPYVDHSGMIASFPKVNFFMSTLGVEAYFRRGMDFMPVALAGRCPPLVVTNHSVLLPGKRQYRMLSETDRQLLETRYVGLWGPIRVAGAEFELTSGADTSFRVACSGRYRIESSVAILVDGSKRSNGDVIELANDRIHVAAMATSLENTTHARMVWAEAHAPPVGSPPQTYLYAPL